MIFYEVSFIHKGFNADGFVEAPIYQGSREYFFFPNVGFLSFKFIFVT